MIKKNKIFIGILFMIVLAMSINMIYAAEAGGSTLIARLPNSSDEEILKVLEVGTQSIMMSHVKNLETAQRFVSYLCCHSGSQQTGIGNLCIFSGVATLGRPAGTGFALRGYCCSKMPGRLNDHSSATVGDSSSAKFFTGNCPCGGRAA